MTQNQEEHKEPTNEQLANFLTIYAQQFPFFKDRNLNPIILETMLCDPSIREAALRHHREFVKELKEVSEAMKEGKLMCNYIRPNGKRCVNHNEPGSFFCGLHNDAA